jgi:lipoate-protein ligase B
MAEPTGTCRVQRLGLVPFADAWRIQEDIARLVAADLAPATLLLLEHSHTYTFGRRGKPENLLWGEAELAERGIEVHWIDRGGDVTYHGPGQLVGYPILPLGRVGQEGRIPQPDYVGYLRRLEETLTLALARLGVASGQLPGLTGVWLQPDVASRCRRCPPAARKAPSKIASIGVKVDARGVSRHGFALNVDPDMRYWQGIVACGLAEAPSISLADLLDQPPAMAAVEDAVVEAFGHVFGFHMTN